MRRAAPLLFATVVALVLLARFHTTTGQAVASKPPESQPSPSTVVTTPPAVGPPGSTPTTSAPTTSAPATSAPQTFDGDVEQNRYGDVQVRVTLQNNQIVDVEALTLPTDRQRSAEISQYAGPQLRQEALQAQSAQIDFISGATFTSESYQQSLQSALDKAGRH